MIDMHVHIGGDEAGFCMNEEMVLKSMEKYQIDISIVSSFIQNPASSPPMCT